jgi:hypothetical protein
LAISLRRPEHLSLTTEGTTANTVVKTHATKKGYTAKNADGIYITVEIGIVEI